MARTKKENQNTTQEPETAEEEYRDTAQEPETAEEESGDTTQEPETERGGEDAEEERDLFAVLPNPCVYCGPSVRGVVRQYTIYQGGGLPLAVKELLMKHPKAVALMVSAGRFPIMRKRLDTPDTPEAKLYKELREDLKRGHSL